MELKFWGLVNNYIDSQQVDLINKLSDIFNKEPTHSDQVTAIKWKELGPLNIEQLLQENKIKIDK